MATQESPVERALGGAGSIGKEPIMSIVMPTPQALTPQPAWATEREVREDGIESVLADSRTIEDGDYVAEVEAVYGVAGDQVVPWAFDALICFTNHQVCGDDEEVFAVSVAQIPELIAFLQRVQSEVGI